MTYNNISYRLYGIDFDRYLTIILYCLIKNIGTVIYKWYVNTLLQIKMSYRFMT